MGKNKICEAVRSVIAEVQEIGGYECPELKGSIRPAKDIEKFSSEIWPAATAMISAKIGKEIPPEENIFYDEKTCEELTLDECVDRILAIVTKEEDQKDKKTTQ